MILVISLSEAQMVMKMRCLWTQSVIMRDVWLLM